MRSPTGEKPKYKAKDHKPTPARVAELMAKVKGNSSMRMGGAWGIGGNWGERKQGDEGNLG